MTDIPYTHLSPDSMILRDYLAVDRTVLANQRSFLACVRTALSLIVAGASFVKFSGSLWFETIGWILFPLGIFLAIVGIIRFVRMKRRIERLLGYHLQSAKIDGKPGAQ